MSSGTSGGQARKIAVLTGLIPAMVSASPTLVLLDEPDAGLDDHAIDSAIEQITSLRSRPWISHRFTQPKNPIDCYEIT